MVDYRSPPSPSSLLPCPLPPAGSVAAVRCSPCCCLPVQTVAPALVVLAVVAAAAVVVVASA